MAFSSQEDNISHHTPDSPSIISDGSNDARTDEKNEADEDHKNVEDLDHNKYYCSYGSHRKESTTCSAQVKRL